MLPLSLLSLNRILNFSKIHSWRYWLCMLDYYVHAAIYYENWKTTSTSRLPFLYQYYSSSIFIMDCGIRTNRKWNYLTCGPTSCFMRQLLSDTLRVRTSLPFGGQSTTDTYNRKLAHMLNNSISCMPQCIIEMEDDQYSRLPFLWRF